MKSSARGPVLNTKKQPIDASRKFPFAVRRLTASGGI
jgi:hypothetical protein